MCGERLSAGADLDRSSSAAISLDEAVTARLRALAEIAEANSTRSSCDEASLRIFGADNAPACDAQGYSNQGGRDTYGHASGLELECTMTRQAI